MYYDGNSLESRQRLNAASRPRVLFGLLISWNNIILIYLAKMGDQLVSNSLPDQYETLAGHTGG